MNIKKSCATCLALLTVCGLNCPGAFASSKSLDEIEMFSRHKRRRHNAIVIPEDELRVVFTDYKEVESAFKASKMKGSAEEEPKMKKVIISEGVETIGREAFYERDDIDEVIIPESVKYIDDYAFANCVNLNNIVIKGEVAIGEHSFEGCENLIEISIKGKINSIYSTSFLKCKRLGIIRLGEFHTPNDRIINAIRYFNAYRDEFGNLVFDTIIVH